MLSVVVTVILAVLSSSEAGIVLDVDTDVGQSSSVKLSVFYESLCGDSIRFITHQLFPTWQHFADDQTLQLDLVPFGKATVRLYRSWRLFISMSILKFTANGETWDFECQHGPEECRGNKVQACILDKVNYPSAKREAKSEECLLLGERSPGVCSSHNLSDGFPVPSWRCWRMYRWPRDGVRLCVGGWGVHDVWYGVQLALRQWTED